MVVMSSCAPNVNLSYAGPLPESTYHVWEFPGMISGEISLCRKADFFCDSTTIKMLKVKYTLCGKPWVLTTHLGDVKCLDKISWKNGLECGYLILYRYCLYNCLCSKVKWQHFTLRGVLRGRNVWLPQGFALLLVHCFFSSYIILERQFLHGSWSIWYERTWYFVM